MPVADAVRQLALNLRYAFRPRKPLLTLRLAKAVLLAKLFRRTRLRYVDFAVDFACNLRCEHCFAAALEQPGRRTMAAADYARVAEQAMRLGAVNFSFQGGEPLLFPRLREVIAACRPSRNVISVTTNGTLLTPERVAELKSWGVDILTVSLDSAIAEEHDRFRGRAGTFEAALAGIERGLAAGMHVTLGAVVTHQSLRSEGIRGLADLAIRKRLILYFILPVRAGRWADNTEMLLTEDDQRFIEEQTRRGPYLRTDFQANLCRTGCGAAKEILYLTPYGDVLVCPFLHISFGNVFEDELATVRARALRVPQLAVYHQKCLASTDDEFVERHLSKTFHAQTLPLRWDEVFGPDDLEGGR
ncbi:MAG TPA: radical SAM protein [Planctomycetota bacterium]|nr:radical SAM protein [Planctomycetota bacterium]